MGASSESRVVGGGTVARKERGCQRKTLAVRIATRHGGGRWLTTCGAVILKRGGITMTLRLLGIGLAALVAMSCANATSRGGVRPAPPGPIDLVRGAVFGDFSGLCPKHYEFCGGGRQSICCPGGG